MNRALLLGWGLGLCALAGYALGRYAEKRETQEKQRAFLLALYPGTSKLGWEQTHDGLWRLRSGGAL